MKNNTILFTFLIVFLIASQIEAINWDILIDTIKDKLGKRSEDREFFDFFTDDNLAALEKALKEY
uniref:Peptide Ctri9677 n=1 Tax=Chaerilus tricostatus TaxID=1055734 RepID=NDB4Q_CHATC|nr:RecName: Full=Peptide Ctri9677; Flags: Precursor [Chaerilus tricostatus]